MFNMKINIDNFTADEFIKKYLENGRLRLSRKIENFKTAPLNIAATMPYIRKEARSAIEQGQSKFLPLLKNCRTLEEVMDVLFEYFEQHPTLWVSEQSIMDYAENYAYLNELEMESNCTCLLKGDTKRRMQRNGLNLDNFQDMLNEENANFTQLTSRELVDFLNKYSKNILN